MSKQGKFCKKNKLFSPEIRTYFFYKDMLYHLSLVFFLSLSLMLIFYPDASAKGEVNFLYQYNFIHCK